MHSYKKALGLLCVAFLSGCAMTEPVMVIDSKGNILQGTTTAALSGGHFNVTGGNFSCSGSYNALDISVSLAIPVSCSDGRQGTILATRDRSGTSGYGTLRLVDGTTGKFFFGARVNDAMSDLDHNNGAISGAGTVTSAAEASGSPVLVPIERSGGVLYIKATLNDSVTLKCILDSGAADLSVPYDVVSTLMRSGTIKPEDVIDQKSYELADGSTTKQIRFLLRTVEVGGITVHNVIASTANARGEVLIGQAFLNKFKTWSIDNASGRLLLVPVE